jgi:hypothetical protein
VLGCPDRLRRVEVIRVEHAPHAMLALGEFVVLGRQPAASSSIHRRSLTPAHALTLRRACGSPPFSSMPPAP